MRKRILRIEDDSGVRDLYPGDTYQLTLSMDMATDRMEAKTTITSQYIWDGKVLKKYVPEKRNDYGQVS